MNKQKETALKKLYTQKLKAAGYKTVPELVKILPPTIQSITGASLATAEKIFVAALKSQMRNVQLKFNGEPSEGISDILTNMGFRTIQEIADANPAILAKTLNISLASAGDIVLFAMELLVRKEKAKVSVGDDFLEEIDREISHYLGKLSRVEKESELQSIIGETVEKIQETIKLPAEEPIIDKSQKERIREVLTEFTTVFPGCVGFALFNRKGLGVFSFYKDNDAKTNLAKINETFSETFWKISLLLENKNEYGWITASPHLIWLEAIRDKVQKRLLAFVGLFLFEENADGVGAATPTIKGIMKEIERIIFSPES